MSVKNTFAVPLPDWGSYPESTLTRPFPGGLAQLYHHCGDDPSVRRLRIWWRQFSLVILPTKGLSVLECTIDGKPLFWDPPLDGIKNPREIDLARTLLINGKEAPGTAWIAQFLGGIEMLGLDTWGMHYQDAGGNLHTLHGNLSAIPATDVCITFETPETLRIEGTVTVHDDVKILPAPGLIPKWRVTKHIVLHPDTKSLEIEDSIQNISPCEAFPDWGYHVQLKPQEGCAFFLPSKRVVERSGNTVPPDHAQWKRAKRIDVREEYGYVHTELNAVGGMVEGLLAYPDGTGLGIKIPHAPYTMVWNSSGGADSKEFLWPSDPEVAIIPKPWDGVGPEIGASDLDHGNRTDPDVVQLPLAPGATQTLRMSITVLDQEKTRNLKNRIFAFSEGNMSDRAISAIASHVWETAVHELERLSEYYDQNAFASCVRLLAERRGRVFVCGVGTSGVAARKLVHSLSCVEIPSYFLNPADAVHGALGAVQSGDIVFLISKGGGTNEIIQLLPSLKVKHTEIIGITEDSESTLGRECDLLLQVRIEKEADTFNMLATTSTMAIIALFDALAIAVMQVSGFTKEQFAIIHPSGAVGDRLLHNR